MGEYMNQDLKIIKNKYGEKMMHLCREMFPTILETQGALSKILLDKFEPTRFLYEDIIKNEMKEEFKSYIYKVFDVSYRKEEIRIEKTPEQLMSDAGYILYECKTEEDIQSFRKYYKKSEELCTFNGERLDNCYVYFAVKKNVDEIKREDFKNPERQDLYGTSVISIQFTKNESHILSIKNRYNHTVSNPDATFGNDLDNIIPGLTDSFELHYGMKQQFKSNDFEIPGYVMASDGRYYKYNMEINNIYYCPNNIIIDNFKVKRYPKEKYIVMDYFILDLKTGGIVLYDEKIEDSFINSMENCDKFEMFKDEDYKKLIFYKEEQEPIVIIIDKLNNIVSLENRNIKRIGSNFLCENKKIEIISLPSAEYIHERFLMRNQELKQISFPKVKEIGERFLFRNKKLQKISLPNIEYIYDLFLNGNTELTEIELPKVRKIKDNFLSGNKVIGKIHLPNVEEIGKNFMNRNTELTEIELPKVRMIDYNFLFKNAMIKKINIPNVEVISDGFLRCNILLKEIDLPKVREIGRNFLGESYGLKKINLPSVEIIPDDFLNNNFEITELDLPCVKEIGKNFLSLNPRLEKINIPKAEIISDNFLYRNTMLTELNMPNVTEIGDNFLYSNENIKEINLPKVEEVQDFFLDKNLELEEIDLPKVREIGFGFLSNNSKIRKISMPNVEVISEGFLNCNNMLKEIYVPNIDVIPEYIFENNPNVEVNVVTNKFIK